MRGPGGVLGQRLALEFSGPLGIETEVELVFHRNSKRALGKALSRLHAWMTLTEIGRVLHPPV